MRAVMKLVAAVLLGTALYVVVGGPGNATFDEAMFTLRVHAAVRTGTPIDDPALQDAADELWERQFGYAVWRHPVPLLDQSDATDEIDTVATAATPAACTETGSCEAPRVAARDLDSPPGDL